MRTRAIAELAILVSFTAMLASAPAIAAAVKWTAVSTTAMSITGDIAVSDDRITFQTGASFGLVPVPDNPRLFTLDPPDDNPVLLNGNTLCSPQHAPKYLAFPTDGDTLYLLAFDGPDLPTLVANPLDQDGICALYTYEK